MENIVIIGGQGFGEEIVWLIERINIVEPKFKILGFINKDLPKGFMIGKYAVLGNDDELSNIEESFSIVIAIGDSKLRKKIANKLISENFTFPTLIDPSVQRSDSVSFGKGCIICCNNIFTVNIKVEDFVIVNLASTIGHDCLFESFVTILPGCNISGNVVIRDQANIGTGVKIIPHCEIGEEAILGAGSVVTKSIPTKCTAVGVPAKPIK